MIRDWEIPSVGGGSMAGRMTKIWRKAQETLLHGPPLLVDAKGRPATDKRQGGMFDKEFYSEWIPSRLVGPDGEPLSGPTEIDHNFLDHGFHGMDLSSKPDAMAMVFSMDYPYQTVWCERPPDLRSRWRKIWDKLELEVWDRPRWKFQDWWQEHRQGARRWSLGFDLYRFDDSSTWRLDLYLGPLVFEWLKEPEAEGGIFWSKGVEDDVMEQLRQGKVTIDPSEWRGVASVPEK